MPDTHSRSAGDREGELARILGIPVPDLEEQREGFRAWLCSQECFVLQLHLLIPPSYVIWDKLLTSEPQFPHL